MWTALPRSADTDMLYLDVFVSPRLGVDAAESRYELSDFPEFEHWPTTLGEHLGFAVEFTDGGRVDAHIVPAALDTAAWEHLFRPSTFVRPWSFRDLTDAEIHSAPVRFVTAYLTALYRDIGRRFPDHPPTPDDLSSMTDTLGPLTDTRVAEERARPPDVPVEVPLPPTPPTPRPSGCLTVFCRFLRPLRRLLRRLATALHTRLGIPGFWRSRSSEPAAPTEPKVRIPRTLHPSPFGPKPPLAPAHLPPLEELERRMATDKVIAPAPKSGAMADALAARDITFDCARLKRFYDRTGDAPPPVTRPSPPDLDFHQALGALGDYPALLRTLGIVIRLQVPRTTSDFSTVRVIPLWDSHTRDSDISPATRVILTGDLFTAAARPDSDLDGGLLNLRGANDRLGSDEPIFDVIQMDTDGSALKAINTAATLERRRQLKQQGLLGIDHRDDADNTATEALAALRSAGLAIIRPDRAHQLHDRLLSTKSQSVPAPSGVPGEPATLADSLFADDLLRGYRIEVSTDGGPWRSLCSRIGTYRLVDETGATVRTLPDIADEGYVKSASGTRRPGSGTPLYVHEALARWTGWSLTAPRPGRTLRNHLDEAPPDGPTDFPELPASTAETEFRLVTAFVPQPGSLPRLRFGHAYRIRVWGVDLAGELLAASADDPAASDPVIFRRHEPAGPPVPLPLRPYLPGESLEHLVLRSDIDISNPDFDEQVWGANPADALAQRTRHFFPPQTSQQMAELHERFDLAFGAGGNPDAGYRLALRESGSLVDPAVVDVNIVDIDHPEPTIDAGEPEAITTEGVDGPSSYVINRSDDILLTPYLPDPLVLGVALRGLPGLENAVTGDAGEVTVMPGRPPLLQIPFTGTWPDLRSLRFRIAEAPPGQTPSPNWDGGQRVLTVFLPKATRATVLYSSYIGPAGLDVHAVWDIIDDDDPAGRLREQAETGAHWMVSPYRALTLTHAVQHSLTAARLRHLRATRTYAGETGAALSGFLELHVASTARIDVIGRWDEWLDDDELGVAQQPREAVGFGLTVSGDWPPDGSFPQPGDTAYHQFGDTRHRRVRYLVRAASRFREFLRADMDLTRDTDPSDEAEVNILNSARPPAPRVLYVLPTFVWPSDPPESPDWPTHTVVRRGGALRVYLDRPWYTTGAGELLGLVLQQDKPLPDTLCTRYGNDPIWAGPDSRALDPKELVPADFPNAVSSEDGLTLPGLPSDLTVRVVAFQPEYNAARKLWYADIELDLRRLPPTYCPFIRMAFVRYQPDSLPNHGPRQPDNFAPDVKLSPVVLSDFAQLSPDRTLSITWIDATHLRATVTGVAPSLPAPTRVAFRIQISRAPAASPRELDWEYADGHAEEVTRQTFADLVAPTTPDSRGQATWSADVELPEDRNGSTHMRLQVAEYEILASDEAFGGALTRLTYAAHVDLN